MGDTIKTIVGGQQGPSNLEIVDLFPYQKEAVKWLVTKKIRLLAFDMGLGKTAMAIRGLDSVHAIKVLIICPTVARINWMREFEMWSHTERNYIILEKLSDEIPKTINDKTKVKYYTRNNSNMDNIVAIVSFTYATKNVEYLKSHNWDCIVADEAHFLKNPTAKRSKSIIGKEGLIHKAKRFWFLTGTPAPNHPGELWIFLFISGATKLSYDEFVMRYCRAIQTSYGLKILGAQVQLIPELREILKKIMLRRKKEDVMTELPPISYSKFNIEPGLVDLEIMPSFTHFFVPTDCRDELLKKLEKEKQMMQLIWDSTPSNVPGRLLSFQSIAKSISTLRRYNGLQKVQGTIQHALNCFENKDMEKVVIFALHQDVIEGLRIGLREFHPQVLFGRTPPHKRQKRIDRFQNDPSAKVFIGNIHAAGTAITLTAAHHVWFVEQDWVPGNNAQAIMRCHRIGQKSKVFVKFITLDGTLDAKVDFILKQKVEDLTKIFD